MLFCTISLIFLSKLIKLELITITLLKLKALTIPILNFYPPE